MLDMLDEPSADMLCRDSHGLRNLRAERLMAERERLRKRLGWAIQKGDPSKVAHLERQLADLERGMREPVDGYAREISRQRHSRRRSS